MEFKMSEPGAYNDSLGYGYDFGTRPGDNSCYFSVKVPDGNYKVTLTLGGTESSSETTVRAESRRLMLDRVSSDKGRSVKRTIMVHKRTPAISLSDTVRINPREVGTPTWDDKLTLEFTGASPAVSEIVIEPADSSVTTVFLCGNSTVVDQVCEPWASWGQIIPSFFNENVVIANHAESGERTSSFISRKRLDKVLSMARPGDWIMMEFGHNDQKDRGEGCGAWYNFSINLKVFIDRAHAKGLNPVLVTPTARRMFDENGRVVNTHGEYVDAIREVARRENVPLIDLNPMTMKLYESLGTEDSKKAFVHYPDGRFPGQTGALADNTHFNPYGATQVAKCVMEGIRANVPGLAGFLKSDVRYDPEHPDDPDRFVWPESQFYDNQKPYGN
ncbi:MAG: rhamnogalacturonan acetylesterase [Bacteroides sp.]|nr:rhamnogalacturonan acetylesterase [Bacteroides sp.]